MCTRELSNSGKLRHILLCEFDKSILLQGVSLERMEIGVSTVVAFQAASMPRNQLRDETGTVREIRKQASPLLPLE